MLKLHYFLKIMLNKFLAFGLFLFISGCTSVVEPVKISGLSPNPKLQEPVSIELLPLTLTAAKALNSQKFPRLLSSPGNAYSAKVIDEELIERDQAPPASKTFTYTLGIGDELAFTQTRIIPAQLIPSPMLGVADQTQPFAASQTVSQQTSEIVTTHSRVGSDEGVLLIGIGRIDAKGRQIADLRDEVRSILIRNGKDPDFQLDILKFNSQKVFITTDEREGRILPITDQGLTLRQSIATAGLPFNERVLTIVKLQREGKTYQFTLSDILSEKTTDIYLKHNDHIIIQHLEYLSGKVFLAGGVAPAIVPIKPEQRQTLAEVLFAPGGPMAVETAQRSAVYLLRGQNPIKAYHLDAQNPARILVADFVELRPNDIVFVGEQPISTFNRVLSTILPLRLFSRDVKDKNLP